MTTRDSLTTSAGQSRSGMPKNTGSTILLLAGLLSCFLPALSTGAEEVAPTPWQISADRLTHNREPQEVVAEGNVLLERPQSVQGQQMEIQADRIRYQVSEEQVQAEGNLTVTAGRDVISANTAEVDLDRRTGIFTDATLFYADNNLYLSGKRLEKTGEDTYRIQEGMLTTCTPVTGEAPPWSFAGTEATITESGRAMLKKVSFRLKDTSVFYLPYMMLPARRNRQSGFLFPEISQSKRDGSGFVTPLFIDLSPSADLTFYPGFVSKRGPVAGLEARYVLTRRSKGTLALNYLHDDIIDGPANDYKGDGYLRTDQERYWLRAKADHDFGASLFGRFDLDLVSDRDYLQEFNKGMTGFGASNAEFTSSFQRGFQAATIPLRESSLQLSKGLGNSTLFGELRGVQDVRDETGLAPPISTLPRLAFGGATSLGSTPLALTWETEYVYYHRHEGIGAQRIDLYPRIVAPLPLAPSLEAAAGAGLRQTLYLVEEDGAAAGTWPHGHWQSRTMADFDISLATTLERDFPLVFLPTAEGRWVNHLLRPELTYIYIPDVSQAKLPQLDARDAIAGRNWLGYRINNLFSLGGGDLPGRRLSTLKISQFYDLEADLHPFSDIFLELETDPTRQLNLSFEAAISLYGQSLPYYGLTATYDNERNFAATATYRYKRNPENNEPFFYNSSPAPSSHELNGVMHFRLSPLVNLTYSGNYSLATGTMIDSSLQLLYQPTCWSLALAVARTPDDSRAVLVFSLAGIGKALEVGLPGL